MRAIAAYGVALAMLAAGCGPIPVDRAERFCARQLSTPQPVTGKAEFGVSDGNFHNGYELDIALQSNAGDPAAAYNSCVVRKSGEFPTRPWHSLGGGA
ncbi:hypothetical protein [Frigidibacter oleivorans]|uniref:hypothetical protein n=1 Tax=Frigidibacter oleivorans TaxID=2487129 RepID=UPI000F8E591A|nr:hypothetical protein [Frigidibacter oleivorans]